MSNNKYQEVPENYQYWRENGSSWGNEYKNRKKFLIYYHIQELLIANYIINSKPSRILEFGCGVGRHLSYLSKIPGVETYGFDQSRSMALNCLSWCTQEWFDSYISIGNPTDSLPYPDNYFDIAFTSEVLIHVRPQDVAGILKELLRVSRWQIFHLEPHSASLLVAGEHAGCWYHDLLRIYGEIGHVCEQLPAGFDTQAMFRVVKDHERSLFTGHPIVLELFQTMERMLQPQLSRAQIEDQRQQDIYASYERRLAALESERAVLEQRFLQEQQQADVLRQQLVVEQVQAEKLATQHQTFLDRLTDALGN